MVKMIPTVLNGEYNIILPEHRANREEWHSANGWEKKRLQSIHANLSDKDTMYYVGTELGDMAALCQIWGAKMVLFEPNPKAWPVIKAIWEANGLEMPLETITMFASDKTTVANGREHGMPLGKWPAYVNEEIVEAHGFKELDEEADTYGQIKIDDVVSISGYIPTAISIDTEGSEGRVLRGAEITLRNYHPKIWLSLHPEFLHEQYGEWARELRKWIMDLGYQEELLAYDHEIHLYYHI